MDSKNPTIPDQIGLLRDDLARVTALVVAVEYQYNARLQDLERVLGFVVGECPSNMTQCAPPDSNVYQGAGNTVTVGRY